MLNARARKIGIFFVFLLFGFCLASDSAEARSGGMILEGPASYEQIDFKYARTKNRVHFFLKACILANSILFVSMSGPRRGVRFALAVAAMSIFWWGISLHATCGASPEYFETSLTFSQMEGIIARDGPRYYAAMEPLYWALALAASSSLFAFLQIRADLLRDSRAQLTRWD